jgi:hypothetical protein
MYPIKSLTVYDMGIKALNVSKCTELSDLVCCRYNRLTKLIVSKNKKLIELDSGNNKWILDI